MPSKRYMALKSGISRIRHALLPRDIDEDIVELKPRTSLRALSFRLLCHAEIEAYLEDRAVEIAKAAEKAWDSRQHISNCTLCMLAFSGRHLEKLPSVLSPPPNKKQRDWDALIKPDRRLSLSVSSYVSGVLNDNHGIKESNIISILLPIGYSPDKLDVLLLTDLNDFGTKRGAAAHKPVMGHVSTGINPRDEFKQVCRIVLGLKSVDSELEKILVAAR